MSGLKPKRPSTAGPRRPADALSAPLGWGDELREQAAAVNQLMIDKKIDPCLSATMTFDEIGQAHQLMRDNKHPYGNMACLVNATEVGQGKS